jgi:hypothetical protein
MCEGDGQFYGRQGATWPALQCKVTVISEDGVSSTALDYQ